VPALAYGPGRNLDYFIKGADRERADADAALIVEAVNAHDALMAVYEAAKRQQGELLYGKHPTAWIPALCDAVDAVDAALPQQEPSQP
jgi:hypothetical protein